MMSSTISIEPSVTPTPPHKMNGGINQRININAYSAAKHNNNILTPVTGHTPIQLSPPPVSHNASCSGPSNSANISTATTKPLLDISRTSTHPGSPSLLDTSRRTLHVSKLSSLPDVESKGRHGIYQVLASLALLCILSILMAFLALFFLQKLGPMTSSQSKDVEKATGSQKKVVVTTEEFVTVFQVSIALSTLTIALDLCCLFVCCIQFLFAIKLLMTPQGDARTQKFLKKSSHTRILAIGGFFLSIPLFFTGVILFTFIHFSEVPAIATSVVIGIGIVFCGIASVQNVYLWQWEKTRACKDLTESRLSQLRDSGLISPEVAAKASMELSTLV